MRVWDISPSQLCNKHLVAQHHEIHCVYNIITKGLKGFAHHPEVMRWRGHIQGLIVKHNITVLDMLKRGMEHNSPIIQHEVTLPTYPEPLQPVEEQVRILKEKHSLAS